MGAGPPITDPMSAYAQAKSSDYQGYVHCRVLERPAIVFHPAIGENGSRENSSRLVQAARCPHVGGLISYATHRGDPLLRLKSQRRRNIDQR
jgi:hypothetical protein